MTRPATNSDKTFKKGISDQSFISKAHEEYLKLKNQKKKIKIKKKQENEQKIITDTSPRKIYDWPRG